MLLNIIRAKLKIYAIVRQLNRLRVQNRIIMQDRKVLRFYERFHRVMLIVATIFGSSVFFKVFVGVKSILSKILILKLERLASSFFVLFFRKSSQKIKQLN